MTHLINKSYRTKTFSISWTENRFWILEKYICIIFKSNLTDIGDTSRWILASSQDVCGKSYAGKTCKDFSTCPTDHILKKGTRRVLKKNLQYGCATSAETTLSAPISFDLIRTHTTDSISFCLQNALSPDGSLVQCETIDAEVGLYFKIKSSKGGQYRKIAYEKWSNFYL